MCLLPVPGSRAPSFQPRLCWSTTSRTTVWLATVRGLPMASRVLEAERNRHRDGLIDVERLMTRLHELMPYDYGDGATHEFSLLLAELKRAFLRRIQDALNGVAVDADVVLFAKHCAEIDATCVTFNYDDFLDAALSVTGRWNPHWGMASFAALGQHRVQLLPSTACLGPSSAQTARFRQLVATSGIHQTLCTRRHRPSPHVGGHLAPPLPPRHRRPTSRAGAGYRSAGPIQVGPRGAACPPPSLVPSVRATLHSRLRHVHRLLVPTQPTLQPGSSSKKP